MAQRLCCAAKEFFENVFNKKIVWSVSGYVKNTFRQERVFRQQFETGHGKVYPFFLHHKLSHVQWIE